jgi:hypothetical protein
MLVCMTPRGRLDPSIRHMDDGVRSEGWRYRLVLQKGRQATAPVLGSQALARPAIERPR